MNKQLKNSDARLWNCKLLKNHETFVVVSQQESQTHASAAKKVGRALERLLPEGFTRMQKKQSADSKIYKKKNRPQKIKNRIGKFHNEKVPKKNCESLSYAKSKIII